MTNHFPSASRAIADAIDTLKTRGAKVDAGHWQGVPTGGKPDLMTKELLNVSFGFQMPPSMGDAQKDIQPNLPWAEDHFQERVSGIPSNPGEEYMNWPWWRGQKQAYDSGIEGAVKFSHTYQERFWPKRANGHESWPSRDMLVGIRYEYGDLDDVIDLLRREPQTRQAYLPIFFPEDTGAVHGGRIPCSLGYHFLVRSGMLHCWYDIRSCDAVRHFRDDLYLATRLVQWVLAQLRGTYEEMRAATDPPPWGRGGDFEDDPFWANVLPGTLFFSAHSFHVHMGDYHLLP